MLLRAVLFIYSSKHPFGLSVFYDRNNRIYCRGGPTWSHDIEFAHEYHYLGYWTIAKTSGEATNG